MNETVNAATTVETTEGLTQTAGVTAPAIPQEPFIVGETSVYKDVASLLKGAQEKEKLIKTLLAENKEYKDQLARFTNIENFKEELQKMTEVQIQTPETVTTNPLSEEEIQKIAVQAMLKQQQESAQEANLAKAMETLAVTFGAEAENKLSIKAKELGMTPEAIKELAKTSPQAFNSLMGIEAPKQVSLDALRGYAHTVSQPTQPTTGLLDEFRGNPNLVHDARYMGDLFEKAVRDPSILDDFEWKVK